LIALVAFGGDSWNRTAVGNDGALAGLRIAFKRLWVPWHTQGYSIMAGYLLVRTSSGSVLSAACGTKTFDASFGKDGTSQRNRSVAAAAPHSWAAMNPGTFIGRIPAKVSLAHRASVTAGLAKDVEEVNQ
jgi:hypothetical protein